ncbi:hypothetical protein [Flavobacterium tegetincola]|uniref:hypothetical protein n=1 Tax=Flavobacterium tegetincola TaxID=150172 RepID=UPI00040DEAC7|nr:hypothetical protein [Flavobacterium tegetincola]
MKNQYNLKYLLAFILLFMSASSFSQIKQSITVKIESGQTTKNYKGEQLESFLVEMVAVNYGNALTFTKANNRIVITNAQEPNATIKIYLNDEKMLGRELLYKNTVYLAVQEIKFDIDNLPKNSTISIEWKNNKPISYGVTLNKLTSEDLDLDKMYKLFVRMDYPNELETDDAIFEHMAEFFSKEDALLRIYEGAYAMQFNKSIVANLKTDEYGKIKEGIIWSPKQNKDGQYQIYSNGKIVVSGDQSLTDFQQTFMAYMIKHQPN